MRCAVNALRLIALSSTILSCHGLAAQAGDANPFAKINHIVVIYTENRSFDNLFIGFPHADGLRLGNALIPQTDHDGSVLKILPPVLLRKLPDARFPLDLPNAPFLVDDYMPEGDKTGVTWAMYGKSSFMMKAVGLFMDCDKMVGAQFEEGLASLKTIAEKPVKP